MKTKEVDGIVYEAHPAFKQFDPVTNTERQVCTGCAGCYDTELCEKLQQCWEDRIVWKMKTS